MSDLIDRQVAIDAIMGEYPDAHYPDWYASKIRALPSAQPELIAQDAYVRGFEQGRTQGKVDAKLQPETKWIPCSERLPEVSYDTLGNWSSDSVLLVFKDGHHDIGYFNPCGVFEVYDMDCGCPVAVGTVRKADEAWQVIAWMPLPEPYRTVEHT